MNIEDCKIGMEVRYKNKKYIVNEIYKDMVRLWGFSHCLLAKEVEPVNKFEVGDEVVWCGDKVEIWGIRYDNEVKEYEYAVIDKNNGRTLLFESELSPLKNKDELEAGDKFKSGCDKYVILFKEYDVARSEIKYLLKDLNTGELLLRGTGNIDEIIYD